MCAGLSRPEVPALVVSYWSESPCSSRLHESRREREEFSGPENWLVTGAARHEMPQKGPQTCAIRPKKLVETSSIVPYCKAVHIWDGTLKFDRAPKINPERVLPTKTARNSHFQKNLYACLYRPEVQARVMSYWLESPCSSRLHESRRDREEFLGPKTSSSRVLRGTKCPKKVPRHAP